MSLDENLSDDAMRHLLRCYSTAHYLQDALFEYWVDWNIAINLAANAGTRIQAVLTSHPGMH